MVTNFNNMVYNFVSAVKEEQNFGHTTNGAVGKKSTGSKLYDLFATGAAYRQRSESDCVLLFKEAYTENPEYAMKCLWYIRDILEGQGERRFFRVCLKWLASYDTQAVLRNLETITRDSFGRWDDLFVLFDTPVEKNVYNLILKQFVTDMNAYQKGAAVSLLAKWAPSPNASSAKTKHNARRIMHYLGVSEREYRKMLSALRERIRVVERLMSQNRWDEIDFSHLPSRAGLIYRNAFKRRDLIARKYREFAQSDASINAGTLYPYDIARKACDLMGSDGYTREYVALDDTERLMINKYWDNLTDYLNDGMPGMMVVADTSGSMTCAYGGNVRPIDVATSLAIYAAERAHGPFANHYISFSRNAKLIEVKGIDFCDKIDCIVRANLCENTNLESVFNLVVDTAMRYNLRPEDVPTSLVVISDMQVDVASNSRTGTTFMDSMRQKWYQKCGGKYEFPKLILWNINAAGSDTNFLDDPKKGVTYVSGCSPVIFTQILKGITGEDLMWETLNSERLKPIH